MAALTASQPETVIFNARFCGRKTSEKEIKQSRFVKEAERPLETKLSDSKNSIFNIKKARYEVIRYGMTGFDKEQQLNSKIAMAIRLGAKPPKKKCVNYKTLIEQKVKEKEALKNNQRSQCNLQPLKQRKKSNKKKKLKKQPNSLV